jgi:hypothetical protein
MSVEHLTLRGDSTSITINAYAKDSLSYCFAF